jgi:phospholipase/carboxylesterase
MALTQMAKAETGPSEVDTSAASQNDCGGNDCEGNDCGGKDCGGQARAVAFDIQSGVFSSSTKDVQHDTVHSLFGPQHYEPGYAYPLLVWLHGPGDDERQLQRIMPLISLRNYVGVAPRGILCDRTALANRGADRHAADNPIAACHSLGGNGLDWPTDDDAQHAAEQPIFDSIDSALRRFNIHARRIFLGGFDTGGTMALRVAMKHPYKFAGVLSIGGALPRIAAKIGTRGATYPLGQGGAPLSRLPEARNLAILLATGRKSSVYGEASVCDDLRLLHTAGLSTNVRLYPCGHEIAPQMLTDIDRWIIEQITGGSQRNS